MSEVFDENPRNIAYYKTDDNGRLKSLCIVHLGLDGTHIKGKYGGTLLAVLGLDANNGLLPFAVYNCQSESGSQYICTRAKAT